MIKMRLLLFIAVIICTFSCQKNKGEDVELKLKKFYSYYILETERAFPNVKLNEDSLQKYCTASFLKKWRDEDEYDIILQAQDYYVEWASTLKVQPLSGSNNKFNLCFPGSQGYCISVTMKKENDEWKIDDVQGNNDKVSK